MRPGHFYPGDRAITIGEMLRTGASMRPGHFYPGDEDLHHEALPSNNALQMRPGHFYPGDAGIANYRASIATQLQ